MFLLKDVFGSFFLFSIDLFYIYIHNRKFNVEFKKANTNSRSPCSFVSCFEYW